METKPTSTGLKLVDVHDFDCCRSKPSVIGQTPVLTSFKHPQWFRSSIASTLFIVTQSNSSRVLQDYLHFLLEKTKSAAVHTKRNYARRHKVLWRDKNNAGFGHYLTVINRPCCNVRDYLNYPYDVIWCTFDFQWSDLYACLQTGKQWNYVRNDLLITIVTRYPSWSCWWCKC